MTDQYRLSCTLQGHEKDVRGLAMLPMPKGAFVSASRDFTSRVWVRNEHGTGYREGLSMGGHVNFVSCVCVLPPDSDHPRGLIVTGSNDCTILAYTTDSPSPVYKLEGHTKAVCALSAGTSGIVVSGSWDHTARVWLKRNHLKTLAGHSASVWCVAFVGEQIITGSADKTLRLWNQEKSERVYEGHTDSVRGVAVVDEKRFLSCSNDATVRLWHLAGSCLKVLTAHSSYIYSIVRLGLQGDLHFATCAEDRCVKIWKEDECVQTIPHPAQSVWCICALPNGDLVTGSSDGMVRLFTTDPSRMADAPELMEYTESVAESSVPDQIGDIKTSDLAGPDVLRKPGKKDGDTLMIKRRNDIEAYQWSSSNGEWVKIGNVVGGESSKDDSDKNLFEGRHYDYLFDVNIHDDLPVLKLPYNRGDDPHQAAGDFIQRNNLSPLYLDNVVQHIVQNVGSSPKTAVSPTTIFNPYADQPSLRGLPSASTSRSEYFPERNFFKFEQINAAGLLGKLKEFNGKVDSSMSVSEAEINTIDSILKRERKSPKEVCPIVHRMLGWPSEMLFLVLDVFRLVALEYDYFEVVLQLQGASSLYRLFESCLSDGGRVKNQLVAARVICNCLHNESGKRFVSDNATALVDCLTTSITTMTKDKNLLVALSSLLLNLSILSGQKSSLSDVESLNSSILMAVHGFLSLAGDSGDDNGEALFRCLVALGNVVSADEVSVAMGLSLGLDSRVKEASRQHSKLEKVRRIADSLLSIFS